jgi:cytochrome b561
MGFAKSSTHPTTYDQELRDAQATGGRIKSRPLRSSPATHLRSHGDPEPIDMRRILQSAQGSAERAADERGRFDQISIALHWTTVLLILVQFTSAWLHEAADENSSLAAAILATHRACGMLTWIVVSVRLVWRHGYAYLPPFPANMSKLQQSIATANEYGLYVLLIVQPITGLSKVLFRGAPFRLLIWDVPALLQPNAEIRDVFAAAHEFGAKALLVLIGLHAGAALYHRLVLRDGVLHRMLPWPPKQTPRARP